MSSSSLPTRTKRQEQNHTRRVQSKQDLNRCKNSRLSEGLKPRRSRCTRSRWDPSCSRDGDLLKVAVEDTCRTRGGMEAEGRGPWCRSSRVTLGGHCASRARGPTAVEGRVAVGWSA